MRVRTISLTMIVFSALWLLGWGFWLLLGRL
jgi:hypothetical protein